MQKGLDYLYVRKDAAISDTLLVVMAPMHSDGFMQYKMLRENQKYDLLFLRDKVDGYYLDSLDGLKFTALIKGYANQYLPENVALLGSSMSAYGALYHGLKINANVIMSNPQLDRAATLRVCKGQMQIIMERTRLISIADILDHKSIDSAIWYSCGHWIMDVENLKEFFACAPNCIRFIIERINCIDHKYFFADVDRIYGIVECLKTLRFIMKPRDAYRPLKG